MKPYSYVCRNRKAVIVDIDNTVMSCDERRAALCSEILGRPVAVGEVWRDLYCSRLLSGELQERYFTDFLSTKLMFLDQPYPLAAGTLDMLRERGIRIILPVRPVPEPGRQGQGDT